MKAVVSVNPVTGQRIELDVVESSADEVATAGERAAHASEFLAQQTLEWRAALLDEMAASLETDAALIIEAADRETGLGEGRLTGELRRTCYQFRFFAGVVRDGDFLEASIDRAGDSPMGPLPDLRRQLEPLGPVGVFGASNFPLAFSVPGGDTASALAAGCAVVVKAHPSHPLTCQITLDALRRAAVSQGSPESTVQLLFGLAAGTQLVEDPHIAAVGFTGSYDAGRVLLDRAQRRPIPIPFYGELGSINPLIVTPRAAQARARELGEGLVASLTLGSGQFCTRPGLLFIPTGGDGDSVVASMRDVLSGSLGASMLSESIRDRFEWGVQTLLSVPGVSLVGRSARASTVSGADAVVAETNVATLLGSHREVLATECFGAAGVVVRYDDEPELLAALEGIDAALTFTFLAEASDPYGPALLAVGRRKAGRVIVNGFPTGVAVSWSMQHGGPLPAATSSLHTSVGAGAIRRWLRPVCYQSVPDDWLPPALQDSNPTRIIRRVDGVLQTQ